MEFKKKNHAGSITKKRGDVSVRYDSPVFDWRDRNRDSTLLILPIIMTITCLMLSTGLCTHLKQGVLTRQLQNSDWSSSQNRLGFLNLKLETRYCFLLLFKTIIEEYLILKLYINLSNRSINIWIINNY